MYTNTLTPCLSKQLVSIFNCPLFIYIKKFVFTQGLSLLQASNNLLLM